MENLDNIPSVLRQRRSKRLQRSNRNLACGGKNERREDTGAHLDSTRRDIDAWREVDSISPARPLRPLNTGTNASVNLVAIAQAQTNTHTNFMVLNRRAFNN